MLNIQELTQKINDYSGITADSRLVKKDFIFVAIKGRTSDGHNHIPEAIKNGAKIVVGEKSPSDIIVDDSREALGTLASAFYGNPSGKLKVIGVTGTKGKTTTCYLIHHILTTLGKKAGLITSIVAKIGNLEVDTGFHVTNPDAVSLQKLLADMVEEKMEYAVIEVSSHGIDQKRIVGTKFDVGVLTNIAPEHLDYHKTFAEYKKVKMSFIRSCKYQVIAPKETSLSILPGKFNNLDIEGSLGAVEKFGVSRESAISALKSFKLPEGRLEEIKNDLGVKIIIDFAHTPDSLEAVLTHLKAQTKGRLITVFGCAGERDTRKRFQMGKISEKLADFSVFTAEDTRTENIHDILRRIGQGAKSVGGVEGKTYIKIPERGEAIAYALSKAQKGDTVALLGKGHEKSMAYDGYEHPWSEKEIVQDIVNSKDDISGVVLAAGKGSRMKCWGPKVLRGICGRPMIAYTLESLRKVGIHDIVAVVSFKKNLVMKEIGPAVKYAFQKNPKGGTADAAKVGYQEISNKSKILLIINGDDSAFYTPETIKKIIEIHKERERKLTFVSLMKENPTGLGRVIRGEDGLITKIVEEKDATSEEKEIKEVNDGLYVFDRKWFDDNIDKVKKGPQGEYYLVDLVKMAIDEGARMATYTLPNDDEWQGINTPEQLEEANKKMERRLNSNL